jgi:flagellin
MAVINTNVKALFSQMALGSSGRAQAVAMQQLSTGKRINSARDDAAGMAIATRMTQQIRGLNQAIRNAGDAITMIQTAEGATNEITDMLQRMRELAVQASNDTNSNEQRSYLDLEFQQLKKQIVQISDQTEWNGFPVLNGSAGERVGERPVYKTASVPLRDSIFISPTTYMQAKDGTGDLAVTEKNATGSAFTTSPYKLSGTLTVKSNGGSPTASFLTSDNKTIDLTIDNTSDLATGEIIFTAGGVNAQVFGDDQTVVYQMGTAGSGPDLTDPTTTARLDVNVNGSIEALPPGQLVINGVQIPASFAKDDPVSPPNNAAGSAIAKAFAINQKSDQTGVVAVVGPNEMTGTAMNQLGTSATTGHLIINGVATATFTTSVNNPRETRATVIRAINLIADKTGVQAVDTGADAKGITLVAKDGRNIEVQLQPTDGTTDELNFSDRIGMQPGVQAGSYSLESRVETPVIVSVTTGGDLAPSGLMAGTYANHWTDETTPHQAINTTVRKLVTGDPTDVDTMPKILKTGDLVINGVAIPGATKDDDKLSGVESEAITNSLREGSAIATANAINSQFAKTGVRAVANPNITEGSMTQVDTNNTGEKSLFVNGVEVKVYFDAGDSAAQRAKNVAAEINAKKGLHGVSASVNEQGGVTLNAEDGRNLAVWLGGVSNLATADEFGLAAKDKLSGTSVPIAGVTELQPLDVPATYADAAVLYSTVGLVSDKSIDIRPGVNGYTLPTDPTTGDELSKFSNFTSLGFHAGSFGGVVQDADNKMTPPRTGRLYFQVGASANQVVTIDLADFGKGGPITSEITWDVDLAAPDPGTPLPAPGKDANGNPIQTPQRSYISSKDAAQSVLTRLDAVMNKVNATRANMGAVMNRLDHVINNLTNVSMNMSTSRSQIEDADYASASTDLAKTQIMQQAATAVLAQANTSQQTVLKLLGG